MTIHDFNKPFIMPEDSTSTTDTLNNLGAEGWELVSFCLRDGGVGTKGYVAVFKRPLNQK